jgi:hypothetical protein
MEYKIIRFKCGLITSISDEKILNPIIIYGNVHNCPIHNWEPYTEVEYITINNSCQKIELENIVLKRIYELMILEFEKLVGSRGTSVSTP